jgi:hypothetical protein
VWHELERGARRACSGGASAPKKEAQRVARRDHRLRGIRTSAPPINSLVPAKGVPFNKDKGDGAIELLKPGLLNVSHILSLIVLEDCTAPENLQDNGNGTFTAICPPPLTP